MTKQSKTIKLGMISSTSISRGAGKDADVVHLPTYISTVTIANTGSGLNGEILESTDIITSVRQEK